MDYFRIHPRLDYLWLRRNQRLEKSNITLLIHPRDASFRIPTWLIIKRGRVKKMKMNKEEKEIIEYLIEELHFAQLDTTRKFTTDRILRQMIAQSNVTLINDLIVKIRKLYAKKYA